MHQCINKEGSASRFTNLTRFKLEPFLSNNPSPTRVFTEVPQTTPKALQPSSVGRPFLRLPRSEKCSPKVIIPIHKSNLSLKNCFVGLSSSKENSEAGFTYLKSEQFAVSLRKSKKKEILGLKRLKNTTIPCTEQSSSQA